MEGGGAFRREASVHYLTEDIMMKILLRLPAAECIARFRCVCKSWRNLFSDPNFLRKFLFSPNSEDLEARSLQILVTGYGEDESSYYSLRSYPTLGPIVDKTRLDLPSPRRPFCIVGSCGGIFCLSRGRHMADGSSDIILWNPSTSETKLLPRTTTTVHSYSTLGFGFDPKTEDYKIVQELRVAGRKPDGQVYSLRNDSWKTASGGGGGASDTNRFNRCAGMDVHQLGNFRNEKCYWFGLEDRDRGCIMSFDMIDESFELCPFPRHSTDVPRYWGWWSCVVSNKDAVLANFRRRDGPCYEMWAMLKYGVVESWTKLFVFAPSLPLHEFECLGSFEDGNYVCLHYDGRSKGGDYFCIFDPAAAGETSHRRRLDKIRGTVAHLGAHAFTPTRVKLSSEKNRPR